MDENEIELIDYLRVMWSGKWIILACLATALVITAAVVWTRPDEYTSTSSYALHESLSTLVLTQSISPVLTNGSPTTQETQDLRDAVAAVDPTSLGKNLIVKTSVDQGQVSVTLTGTVSAVQIREALTRLTPLVQAEAGGIIEKQVSAVTADLTLRLDQATQQRDLLRQQMAAISSPDDPLLAALANKVADLELGIAQLQTALSMLKKTPASELFTLETIGRPVVSRSGPHRKMSLAVAGVLGLFIGILFAFFIHYLRTAGKRERPETR